jgi:hypothetical protein
MKNICFFIVYFRLSKMRSMQRTDVLDRLQMEAAQLTDRTVDCDWENLAERMTIARLWALFKAYSGEWAWKAIRRGFEGLTV